MHKININIIETLITVQANAISSLSYLFSANRWLILLIFGTIGCIILLLKEEIDGAVREEQNMI